MKALFVGGTGIISTAVSALALERGWELTLLNRGQHRNDIPAGAESLVLDINDTEAVKKALEGKYYDVIADWIVFTPEQAKRDIKLFSGHCDQYIVTSTCASYERPMRDVFVTESTCQTNPYSAYGRNKRKVEEVLLDAYRETGFPVTIVRPSLTYGDSMIPYAVNSWRLPWSMPKRILDGRPIVVHGDGTGIWTMTHSTDFAKGYVGLMGNWKAIGEAFHITSDELLTWDEMAILIAKALGKPAPEMVHCTAQQIMRFMPEEESNLLGDKSSCVIMDNSKIKHFVPDFVCTTRFEEGVRRSVQYFLAHPELQIVDEEWDRKIDEIIEADRQFYPKN